MRWCTYVAHFLGGMFLVNAIPHSVSGLLGRAFPSPFASPPGQGESTALINVLWGAFNLVVGYVLISRVSTFDLRRTRDVLLIGAGGLLMAVMLSQLFGPLYGGA